ncbi:MAG TPA: hypothetical protein VJB82_04425 [Candidatus Peribacterales bacterium]|nr:hypothetical protein [Candidatus Peribacterales bacterium]
MAIRDLTGDEARQLIDDVLSRVKEDFIVHLSWKREKAQNQIEQHLSFHGTWSTQEIVATGKGRNEQIEELIMRSMKQGGDGERAS